MKTYIYGYNNCITVTVRADNENDAYLTLEEYIATIEYEYPIQLPDLNCFDLITCY